MLEIAFSSTRNGVKTCVLTGRLDADSYEELDAELEPVLASGVTRLVFDLTRLEYISSAGIRCFVKAQKALKGAGGETSILNPQPQIQKVFDIVKAIPTRNVFTSVAELDAYLDAIQMKAVAEDKDS